MIAQAEDQTDAGRQRAFVLVGAGEPVGTGGAGDAGQAEVRRAGAHAAEVEANAPARRFIDLQADAIDEGGAVAAAVLHARERRAAGVIPDVARANEHEGAVLGFARREMHDAGAVEKGA